MISSWNQEVPSCRKMRASSPVCFFVRCLVLILPCNSPRGLASPVLFRPMPRERSACFSFWMTLRHARHLHLQQVQVSGSKCGAHPPLGFGALRDHAKHCVSCSAVNAYPPRSVQSDVIAKSTQDSGFYRVPHNYLNSDFEFQPTNAVEKFS
jgi:hypothetical protein